MGKRKNKIPFIRITKKFNFEMAHTLLNYDGPCRNIHGHSYSLFVTMIGKPCIVEDHPKNGLVIDFVDIKKAVNKEVIDHFDHALALNDKAPATMVKVLEDQFDKILLLPYQPSCENLIIDIKNRLVDVFNDNCRLFSIRLQETSTSWAEWYAMDNV